MKAMICRQWGGPEDLKLEDVAPAPLKAGQVRIRVKAAGVSFAMTLVIAGKYQRRPPFPFAPGTEATGGGTEVGQGCPRGEGGGEGMAALDRGRLAGGAGTPQGHGFPKAKNVRLFQAH